MLVQPVPAVMTIDKMGVGDMSRPAHSREPDARRPRRQTRRGLPGRTRKSGTAGWNGGSPSNGHSKGSMLRRGLDPVSAFSQAVTPGARTPGRWRHSRSGFKLLRLRRRCLKRPLQQASGGVLQPDAGPDGRGSQPEGSLAPALHPGTRLAQTGRHSSSFSCDDGSVCRANDAALNAVGAPRSRSSSRPIEAGWKSDGIQRCRRAGPSGGIRP